MSVWMAASVVLVCGFVPCLFACLRADAPAALAALQVAGVLAVVLLLTLTVAFKRPPFVDLAVVLAPLAIAGSLAFVRFLGRRH